MQLDKFTDYGLRILMTLAVHIPDRVPVSRIAEMFDVSEHHLSKVATELVRGGFVKSERGRAGGLRLAKLPKDICVGTVVRQLKQDAPVVECVGNENACHILPACGLRKPLLDAQEAFYAVLDGYTLQDVTAKRSALASLLELQA